MSSNEDENENEMNMKLRKQDQMNVGCILGKLKSEITKYLKTTVTIEDNLSHIIIIKNFIESLKQEISAKKYLKLNVMQEISNGAINELNTAIKYLHMKDDFLNEQYEILKQKEMNINIREKVIKGIINNKIKNINNISSKQYFIPKKKKISQQTKINSNHIQHNNNYKLFLLLEQIITQNKLIKRYMKQDKCLYKKQNKIKSFYKKNNSVKDISSYPQKQYLLTNVDRDKRRFSYGIRDYDKQKGRTVCMDEEMNSSILSKHDIQEFELGNENIKNGIKNKIKSTIKSRKNVNNEFHIQDKEQTGKETPNENISFAGTFGQMKVKLVNTPVCSRSHEELRESYSTGQIHLQELKEKIDELSKRENAIENEIHNNEIMPKIKNSNDKEINLRRTYFYGKSFINVNNKNNISQKENEVKVLKQNKSLRSNKKTEELNSFLDSLLLSTKKSLEPDNYSQEALNTHGSIQISKFNNEKEINLNENDNCLIGSAFHVRTRNNCWNLLRKDEKLNSDDNINNLTERKIFQLPISNTYNMTGRKNILADLLKEENEYYIEINNNIDNKGMIPITENLNLSSSYENDNVYQEDNKNNYGRTSEKKDTEKSQCIFYENGISSQHKQIDELICSSSDENSFPILISPLKRSSNIKFSQSIDKHKNDALSNSNIINLKSMEQSIKQSYSYSSSKEFKQSKENNFYHKYNSEKIRNINMHFINKNEINDLKHKKLNKSYEKYNNEKSKINNSFTQDKFKQIQEKCKISTSHVRERKHKKSLSKFNHDNFPINSNKHSIHLTKEFDFDDDIINININNDIKCQHNQHYNTNISSNKESTYTKEQKCKQNECIEYYYYSYDQKGKLRSKENKHILKNKSKNKNIVNLDIKEETNENINKNKKNITIYLECSSESNDEDNVNQQLITPQSIALGVDYYPQKKQKYRNSKENIYQDIPTPQSIPLGIDFYPKKNEHNSYSENKINQDVLTPQSIPLGIDYCQKENENNQNNEQHQEVLTPQSIPIGINYNYNNKASNVNEDEALLIYSVDKTIKSNDNEIDNNKNTNDILNYNGNLVSSSNISEEDQKEISKLKEINNEYATLTQEDKHIIEIKEQLIKNMLLNNISSQNENTSQCINNELILQANNININNNENKKINISENKITIPPILPMDNQYKTVTKETEIPSSPQEPFYHKIQLNNSPSINQSNSNSDSEITLIELPSSKTKQPSPIQNINIPQSFPKDSYSITDIPFTPYTHINNSSFSIYSQDNNNNIQNQLSPLMHNSFEQKEDNKHNFIQESPVSVCVSGFCEESFESRKTALLPIKRPYIFSESSIIFGENSFCITQPPRKTIGPIIHSCRPTLKPGIKKFDFFGLFKRKEEKKVPKLITPKIKTDNLKEIIIKENIKQGIKNLTNNFFKKHIFYMLKNLPNKYINM